MGKDTLSLHNRKKDGAAILTPDKVDFIAKNILKDKVRLVQNDKGVSLRGYHNSKHVCA